MIRILDRFVTDVKGGVKALARSRGSSSVAVLSIALGIGANLLVFAIVDAVLLRPFPYRDPSRLVYLWGTKSDEVRRGVSEPDMDDWRDQSRSFTNIDAFLEQMTYSVGESGDTVNGACVGPSVLPILGVTPALGRNFTTEESSGAGEPVVIVSDGFWRTRMGRVPSAIGSALMLNGRSFEVVGVTPKGFFFPDTNSQILQVSPCGMTNFRARGTPVMHAIGRLRDGVSIAQAQGDLDFINQRLAQAYQETDKNVTVGVQPLRNIVVGKYERALWLLLAAVGLVLLIACANVAHLQLARGVDRQVELAVRSALGAERGRLFGQLLSESLVVALAGAGCALGFAWAGIRVIRSLSLRDVARIDAARLDMPLIGLAALLALLVTVVSGMWPAWKNAGVDVNDTLKLGTGTVTTSPKRAARELLATTELGLATVLLVGAGLLVGSFVRLSTANWGFNPTGLVAALVVPPQGASASTASYSLWTSSLCARISHIPGVDSVAAAEGLPLQYSWWPSSVRSNGRIVSAGGWNIDAGYFRTLGTPILAGREFTKRDDASAERVTVVSRAVAQSLWPGQSALGRHLDVITFRTFTGARMPSVEARRRRHDPTVLTDPSITEIVTVKVVGVVEDIRAFGLDTNPAPAYYLESRQAPPGRLRVEYARLAIRTDGDISALMREIKPTVAAASPGAQVRSIDRMSDVVAHSIGGRGSARLMMLVSVLFGALALLLTMSGIFGIVLHTVTQRLPEIGVRMALGADRGDIARLLFAYAGRIIIGGITLGTAAAWAASRTVRSLVFGVTPTDPTTYVMSVVLLIACVFAACALPIRRAMRFDPTTLLRR